MKSWKHKGLRKFFETGSVAGIQADHKMKSKMILQRLNAAIKADDMDLPGMRFHSLKGKLQGHYSVTVNGNWRITYKFEEQDAVIVDYVDYH